MEGRRWIRRKTQPQRQNAVSVLSHRDDRGLVTAVSPGCSDTPPAKHSHQHSCVEFWCGKSLLAQKNGFKPFCSVPQRCMHEQAPSHHITISKESGLLLNAREHRGSQDTTSQVSTKAQSATSIYMMKTATITIWSQTPCIPAPGCQMF